MSSSSESRVLPSMATPPISIAQLKAFAEAARDPNPIHQDEETAVANGLPGIIAHGMLVASYLSEYAESLRAEIFGPAVRLARLQVRFKGMTRLGESLTLQGTLRDLEVGKVLLQLEAIGAEGELKSTAAATLWKK